MHAAQARSRSHTMSEWHATMHARALAPKQPAHAHVLVAWLGI